MLCTESRGELGSVPGETNTDYSLVHRQTQIELVKCEIEVGLTFTPIKNQKMRYKHFNNVCVSFLI